MHRKRLYPVARNLRNICQILKLSPERILRRAGLPIDLIANEGKGVDAAAFFDLWKAVHVEFGSLDEIMQTAIAYARGPFAPPLFAFSCSANIRQGIERLSYFKPLLAPMHLRFEEHEDRFTFWMEPVGIDSRVPDTQGLWELVFLIECCRVFTVEPIVPLAISCPKVDGDMGPFEDYFGTDLGVSDGPVVTLSMEDALRPMISENEQLWAHFEKDLQKQLLEGEQSSPASLRVRNALLELLPAGCATSDGVADKLMVGKRTLQRQLKDEGKSFQQILDATRSELSLHYLKQDELSVEEISYLLAYREPNSFYRAFQGWTGMTPKEARAQNVYMD